VQVFIGMHGIPKLLRTFLCAEFVRHILLSEKETFSDMEVFKAKGTCRYEGMSRLGKLNQVPLGEQRT
jgi:hypothetical protein